MEDQALLIEGLFERIKHYAKTSVELFKLKAIDRSADLVSTLAARLVIILSIFFFFLVLNIALALWIGEMLGRTSSGFFIIAGSYALAGILLYFFRDKWIKVPLRNLIISQSLK